MLHPEGVSQLHTDDLPADGGHKLGVLEESLKPIVEVGPEFRWPSVVAYVAVETTTNMSPPKAVNIISCYKRIHVLNQLLRLSEL